MPPSVPTAVHRKPRKKRTVACNLCRERKVRCDGNKPCSTCTDHNEDCVVRNRRLVYDNEISVSSQENRLLDRLARLESLLQAANTGQISCTTAPAAAAMQLARADETSPLTISQTLNMQSASAQASPSDTRTTDSLLSQSLISVNCPDPIVSNVTDDDVSVCSMEMSNLEYAGPRTTMSIYSEAGIQWVTAAHGASDFRSLAQKHMQEIVQRLKMTHRPHAQRAPEPPPHLAKQYIQAFYQHSPVASFDMVPQAWFEARTESSSNNTRNASDSSDPSWYALKNVIYAHGLRISMAGKMSFTEICQQSWNLFENALSVQLDIIYARTSLLGVQALILMAWFTEGLGSPAIQYMLCANAARLACSIGLHKKPSNSWKLTQEDIRRRNWTFWAVYWSEKLMLSRSGRGPAIDDDEITCEIPNIPRSGQSPRTWYCKSLIKLAQLSSRVHHDLLSARALRQPVKAVATAVKLLDSALSEFAVSVQHIIDLNRPFEAFQPSPQLNTEQALMLYSTYNILLFQVHTTVTYPWFKIGSAMKISDADFVTLSEKKVMEASRATLLATAFVRINAESSIQFAFNAPMYACNNVFINLLEHPEAISAQSDLAMLEIGAGYLARVGIITDARYKASIVKGMIKIATDRLEAQPTSRYDDAHCLTSRASQSISQTHERGSSTELGNNAKIPETDQVTHDACEMEQWSTLFSFGAFENDTSSLMYGSYLNEY